MIDIVFSITPFWQGFIACIGTVVAIIVAYGFCWIALFAKKFNVW
jgi:hypothetical protein